MWDFGIKNVLYLKLLFSRVPKCSIRRSVWDNTPAISQKSGLFSQLGFSGKQQQQQMPVRIDNYMSSIYFLVLQMVANIVVLQHPCLFYQSDVILILPLVVATLGCMPDGTYVPIFVSCLIHVFRI